MRQRSPSSALIEFETEEILSETNVQKDLYKNFPYLKVLVIFIQKILIRKIYSILHSVYYAINIKYTLD